MYASGDAETFIDIECRLMTENNQEVVTFVPLKISGTDYINWDGDDNAAVTYALSQSPFVGKITVTGNWIPPVSSYE